VFFSELMATQTALARLLSRQRLEANDLGNVATGLGVRFARSVTGLASLILHATVIEHRLPVRPVIVGLRDVVVAAAAGISAGIEGRIGRITHKLLVLCLLGRRLLARSRFFF